MRGKFRHGRLQSTVCRWALLLRDAKLSGPSDITCSDYKGCLVLYAVDGEDDGADVAAVETQAPASTGGDGGDDGSRLYEVIMTACEVDADMQDCKSLCVDGRCCFESQSCQAPSDITCADYKGCLVVYAVDGGDDTSGATGTETQAPDSSGGTNDNEIGSLYTLVMAACEEGGDTQYCESVCADGRCCFASQNCQASSDITCSDYTGCSTIYAVDGGDGAATTNPNDYTADDIAAACSDTSTLSMCSQMCSGSECCFNSDLTCSVTVDCDVYDACSKVWTR
ncbi:hypothetical protein MHU86_23749 [Fragilaria crotonensis]|nr:hypothetical protein MHU86_23749 [Fragilaria crotonensis]